MWTGVYQRLYIKGVYGALGSVQKALKVEKDFRR